MKAEPIVDHVDDPLTCDGCGHEDPVLRAGFFTTDLDAGTVTDASGDVHHWWHVTQTQRLSKMAEERPLTFYCGFCYKSSVAYSIATYPGQADDTIATLYVETTRMLNQLRVELVAAVIA